MVNDGNAVVVANAVAAILEISRSSGKNYLRLKSD
jgi:vesicle coat complex subunit